MSHKRVVRFLLSASSVWGAATALAGAVPDLYHGADLKHGEQLIAEHKCTACHQRKFGGDGNAIYRPAGQELNLGLFPEDVTSISAVLNRDHYRFK